MSESLFYFLLISMLSSCGGFNYTLVQHHQHMTLFQNFRGMIHTVIMCKDIECRGGLVVVHVWLRVFHWTEQNSGKHGIM